MTIALIDCIAMAQRKLDEQNVPKVDRRFRVTEELYKQLLIELEPYLTQDTKGLDKVMGFTIEVIDKCQ